MNDENEAYQLMWIIDFQEHSHLVCVCPWSGEWNQTLI